MKNNKVEYKNIFVIVFIVIIILVVFYFFTIFLTSRKDKIVNNSVIVYDEILAGSTFNMKEDSYYVIFYKSGDNILLDSVNNYRAKKDKKLYFVDLNSGFNLDIISSEVKEADVVQDLRVVDPTLLKIENKKIKEIITGKDNIVEYLK